MPVAIGRLLLIRCRVLPNLRIKETLKTSRRSRSLAVATTNATKLRPPGPAEGFSQDSLQVFRFLGVQQPLFPRLPQRPIARGNVVGLPFRFVNGQQIVLAVSINHTGPYNFLLDSGTQSTMIAFSLAEPFI